MIIFYSDIDNTLIYSYKYNIGEDKVGVEEYQGRKISYMTKESYQLLDYIYKKILFVPTTTRTIEQYNRINLGMVKPKFALVCNGGILLKDGKEDIEWYQDTRLMVEGCQEELKKAEKYLEKDKDRDFEVRNIRELFLFTKSKQPDKSIKLLKQVLDLSLVDVFSNKVKVYVIPKKLTKGMALLRFQQKLKAENLNYLTTKEKKYYSLERIKKEEIRKKEIKQEKTTEKSVIIAAGDSEFDIPMLKEADIALIPCELNKKIFFHKKIFSCKSGSLFSDFVLKYIKNLAEKEIE